VGFWGSAACYGTLNQKDIVKHSPRPDVVGSAIATCAIMADLRAGMDGITSAPAPFAKADRSRFLQALDEALVRMG
jgi:uncharacterized protein YaiI (UPF0178 family)